MVRRNSYERQRRRRRRTRRSRHTAEERNGNGRQTGESQGGGSDGGGGQIKVDPNAVANRALDTAIGVVVGAAVTRLVFGNDD